MDNSSKIRLVDFDVHMPLKNADQDPRSTFVKTIKIPVYGGPNEDETFLTPEAHLLIDEVKIREYFSILPNHEEFMNSENEALDKLTPNEAIKTFDGQRALICLAFHLDLYTKYKQNKN